MELALGLLVLVAVVCAGSALGRKLDVSVPLLLVLAGVAGSFLPFVPRIELNQELVLVGLLPPLLYAAALRTSLFDFGSNRRAIGLLSVGYVIFGTLAVGLVVWWLFPEIPLAAAIALGAVVAPPDAVAATAVLRQLRPPQRILTILEGESLLNDATALLIFRLALGAVEADGFSAGALGPAFLLGVAGSVVAGPALGWAALQLFDRVRHIPTAIILQFVTTYGVWLLAEHLGLSAVLTMVCYAATVARTAPARTPARMRIPTYAVWETAVFALNILAFIFIGLQIGPILGSLEAAERGRYLVVAGAVLLTVIVVRLAWQMSFNAVIRRRHRRVGFHPPRPMLRPTVGSGLIISWSGMRGIVSLAAAMALPSGFPFRDLIVLTAFAVVLGTLVIHGQTLKPLLRALKMHDGDPVGREVRAARERALQAGLANFADDHSAVADAVRKEFTAHLTHAGPDAETNAARFAHGELHRDALTAARNAVLAMRDGDEIGDDAFHQIEEELDWLEMAGRVTRDNS